MSQHAEEAAVRGHGPRPGACDHDESVAHFRTPPHGEDLTLMWCGQCGAIQVSGEWRRPTMLAEAVRDRDTMCQTLTIAQEVGTKLVEENRLLRARAARFGV